MMSIENSSGSRRRQHSLATSRGFVALATSALSFLAPYYYPTMAQHAPLVNFLSRLNTDVGAGAEKEFLTTTGLAPAERPRTLAEPPCGRIKQ